MQPAPMAYQPLDRLKSRAQREAEKCLKTGEYVLAKTVASRLGIDIKTARSSLGNPDKTCGSGKQVIFLYCTQRAEKFIEDYGAKN